VRETVRLFRPTVVCDLDGTLLDVRRRYFEVYCDLAPTKRLISAERYWSLKRRGYSDRKIVALTVDDARALAAYDRKRLRVIESARYLKLDTLVPGAEAVLADLAKRFNLVIITARQEHRRLLEQLDALGISRHFAAILSTGLASGEQITIKKTRLIRTLDVPVAAMIGDAASDIEIARRVCASSIAATYGIRTRAMLAKAKPDHFVNSIKVFPKLVDQIAGPRRALWPLEWAETQHDTR
jgi:phosphoglycolate phosphatase-like HAD superfamily hydrolase